MGSVAVVGDHGSGRAVFIGLLYASLVRYAGESPGRLRFHADPASMEVLGHLYEGLRSGEFPSWQGDAPSEVGLALQLVRSPSHGFLGRLRPPRPEGEDPSVELAISRTSPETVDRFIATGGALTPFAAGLLSGGALVSLVDATGLRLEPSTSKALPHPWDLPLAGLLRSLLAAATDHPSVRSKRLRPLLVLSKYDLVDPRVRAVLLPQGATMDGWTEDTRAEATRNLLTRFLPRTGEVLRSSAQGPVPLATPSTFVSWVLPETLGDRAGGLKGHATADRGWEPDYPYLEYRDLIEKLGSP